MTPVTPMSHLSERAVGSKTHTQNREYECSGKSYGSKLINTSLQRSLFVDTQTATNFLSSVIEKWTCDVFIAVVEFIQLKNSVHL